MEIYIVNAVLLTLVGLAVEKFAQSKWLIKVYCIYCFIQLTMIAAFRIRFGN